VSEFLCPITLNELLFSWFLIRCKECTSYPQLTGCFVEDHICRRQPRDKVSERVWMVHFPESSARRISQARNGMVMKCSSASRWPSAEGRQGGDRHVFLIQLAALVYSAGSSRRLIISAPFMSPVSSGAPPSPSMPPDTGTCSYGRVWTAARASSCSYRWHNDWFNDSLVQRLREIRCRKL